MATKLSGLAIIALSALASAFLAGCGGVGADRPPGVRDPELIFINLVPDSGPLSFTLNDVRQGTLLPYLASTPEFISVPFRGSADDAYDAAVGEPDGSFVYDSEARVFDFETSSSIIAVGQKNALPGEESKLIRLLFLNVPREVPIGNRTRLLIVHAFNRGPGSSTPKVIFQSPGDNPQYRTSEIDYRGFAEITVDSGPNEFVVKRADGDAIYAQISVNLPPGKNYLTLISGIEGDAVEARRPRITLIDVPPRP